MYRDNQHGHFFSAPVNKTQDQSIVKRHGIKAVLFDVFGTVVNWRKTINDEFASIFKQKKIENINCEMFVADWVKAYSENMRQISEGKQSFLIVDVLNKQALIEIIQKYNVCNQFNNEEIEDMAKVWHRLEPWPDSVAGINKLKKQFTVGTLSNGNIQLLKQLSNNANIQWDEILSGETFHEYKPNPCVYLKAADALNLKPSEILLVASHKFDLNAAKLCGYQTAYIFRPLEFKTVKEAQKPKEDEFDFSIASIDALAKMLKELNLEKTSCQPCK